tara:strand:+ start:57 stop:251 length:195 start_codon:yes stop_codon:yes gene_type:complete
MVILRKVKMPTTIITTATLTGDKNRRTTEIKGLKCNKCGCPKFAIQNGECICIHCGAIVYGGMI